jgi:UDP-N-acetyl-D-galactosamine dehydrogenase
MKKIAVIGLGYVGLPLAVEFGKLRDVIGFDTSKKRVQELSLGNDITGETSTEQLIASKNLQISCIPESIKNANIFIVTVPTPIDIANKPNLEPLVSACKTIGLFLKKDDIVIFESTVYPGCTEEVCVPILESVSAMKFNVDFFCGYSPERINPGDKVNTLKTVRKITSGSNEEVSLEVDSLYNEIITAGTYRATSIKVAEAAKVIENTQRDLNIALINEFSVIFERLNIDTKEVLDAACSKWNFLNFRPGLVGGHCIGVDPYYLTYKAETVGYIPQVILAGRRLNDNMGRYAARNIIKNMINKDINPIKSRVGVMGVTFKENCSDIRNSKVFDMIEEFKKWNLNVLAYDPIANKEDVLREYGVDLVDLSMFNDLDSIVVAVGHEAFKKFRVKDLKKMCRTSQPIFGDLKSIYEKQDLINNGFTVFRF